MLTPELRRRLSAIAGTLSGGELAIRYQVCASPTKVQTEVCRLEDLVPGEVREHEGGTLYVSERSLRQVYPAGIEKIESYMARLEDWGFDPEEATFLDIETCGLGNRPLFLVGTMSANEGDIRIIQYFARDYSEEQAVLNCLREVMPKYRLLLTYNGRSFDIPYILDRMVFHGVPFEFTQQHRDLLVEARRRWRGVLPDCRLQTVEACFCGRRRVGDTPGELIPQLYHDFVRTGNASLIEGVFHHNALDLITMAEIILAMEESGDG